mmetsp:Transcript_124829/g.296208  ORF Transcript_124829/g.296208 Transcript_124829/m.296208 type:complete len:877 (-) Transcript_124829:87-2717(-)
MWSRHLRQRPWRLTRAFGSAETVGEFRRSAEVKGITIVSDEASADHALSVLKRLGDRVHGWDTETVEVVPGRKGHTPRLMGRVVCATAYCGDDVDFGNGPGLLVDNMGPAAGLLRRKFQAYFEDSEFKKVFHNYAFDKLMFKREGVSVQGLCADTLVLARLHDTSLSSWEGASRIAAEKKGKKDQIKEAFEAREVKQSRAVGVAFAGQSMNMQSSQLNSRSLHIPIVEQEGKRTKLPTVPEQGYGLKSLAKLYGFAEEGEATPFRAFGVGADAALLQFDCPEKFPSFATYAAKDAEYTYKLFQYFRDQLQAMPWSSEAHMRPLHQLLLDTAVVQELKRSPQQLFSLGKKRQQRSGPVAGTPGSVQLQTGKNMWDFFELHMSGKFSECLVDMQERGMPVDLDALKSIEKRTKEDLDRTELRFQELLVEIFGPQGSARNPEAAFLNTSSSRQLQTLLFGGAKNSKDQRLQLQVTHEFPVPMERKAKGGAKHFRVSSWELEPPKGRKNRTELGWPSASKEVLGQLISSPAQNVHRQLLSSGWDPQMAAKAEEAVKLLLEIKSIKAIQRYAPSLQTYAPNGRIHPSFAFNTSTGRLSCSRPNLQNLPTSSKDDYGIRSAFRAEPGHSFIMADYSQLELRILAHMSKCESMMEHFKTGGDYHSETAADMYDYIKKAIDEGKVSTSGNGPSVKSRFPQERSSAKAINFGIAYGATAQSLSESLGVSEDKAQEMMKAWFSKKPSVKRWIEDVKAEARRSKRSTSLLGRYRNLPLLDDKMPLFIHSRCERAAVNYAIQGSAADVVTAAMLRLWSHPRLKELGFQLVLQVHDEFVLQGPTEAAEEATQIVKQLMVAPLKETNPGFSLAVPLEVSLAICSDLGEKA